MKKSMALLAAAALLLALLAGCGAGGGPAPADGCYRVAVTLSGGTGRAAVESPAPLCVRDGKLTATVIWSSASYDYMIVDGVKYAPVRVDTHAVFEIPIAGLDVEIPVIANTVAMGRPHEIDYTLRFDSATLAADSASGPDWATLAVQERLPLQYATQFAVTKYAGGYALIDIPGSGRYLTVPAGAPCPAGLPEDVTALYQPLDRIYLAATSAMDLFRTLDGVDAIRLSGADADGWYLEEARQALAEGRMLFAGKYSAPDYELICAEGCDLAIESTMIQHTPAVREQLEKLGVPVLVERSSYEGDPLGRMEWLKLYGVLLGREAQAEALFSREVAALAPILEQQSTGKTVAFFYITTTGSVNVRKSGDYVARMIEMAGGAYVFSDLGEEENALSTVNMTMEAFYAGAKDADVLIYNSAIDGALQTVDALLAKSPLLREFKAVRSGDVWCTGENLFQEPMGLGRLIADIHQVLTDGPAASGLAYLHRLTD